LLSVLVALVVIDYLTGFAAAALDGKLSSDVGFKGGIRKLMIFAFVAIGHWIDNVLGDKLGEMFSFFDVGHGFRDGITFYYLVNELLSIIENSDRLGVPIPSVLRRAVEKLQEQTKEDDQHDGQNRA